MALNSNVKKRYKTYSIKIRAAKKYKTYSLINGNLSITQSFSIKRTMKK